MIPGRYINKRKYKASMLVTVAPKKELKNAPSQPSLNRQTSQGMTSSASLPRHEAALQSQTKTVML